MTVDQTAHRKALLTLDDAVTIAKKLNALTNRGVHLHAIERVPPTGSAEVAWRVVAGIHNDPEKRIYFTDARTWDADLMSLGHSNGWAAGIAMAHAAPVGEPDTSEAQLEASTR